MNPAELSGARVLVVGLGRSGVAAARALRARGAQVTATDVRAEADIAEAPALAREGCALALGGHPSAVFADPDLVILSPGVRGDLAPLAAARERGVPIWGELELAYRLHGGRWIAITGTCGKTTTTLWVAEMLKASSVPHVVGGNLGDPMCAVLAAGLSNRAVVAEVSSFQLESTDTFHPAVAALLNLSEDHLDRYPDLAAYADAKARIFRRQGQDDVAILHADDPALAGLRASVAAGRRLFSANRAGRALSAWSEAGMLWARLGFDDRPVELAGIGHLRLAGTHSIENALAAALAALSAGATLDGVRHGLRSFTGVAHRQELVAEFRGVRFVNDSQATKIASVRIALLSYPRVVLIAGGRDKGAPFEQVEPLVRARARRVLAIGEAAERLLRAWGSACTVEKVESLEAAVERAAQIAEPGDTVLLSPGCASFDLFRDYRERGDRFREAVAAWIRRKEGQ